MDDADALALVERACAAGSGEAAPLDPALEAGRARGAAGPLDESENEAENSRAKWFGSIRSGSETYSLPFGAHGARRI